MDKITAILLTNNEVDLTKIKSTSIVEWMQTEFNIILISNSNEVEQSLISNPSAVLVTYSDSCFDWNLRLEYEIRSRWIHVENLDNLGDKIVACYSNFIVNKNAQKLFSIITSTYNTSKLQLDRAYNSLKNQTYDNWEWVIVDDSTTDFVHQYVKEQVDHKIKYFKQSNTGNIGYNKRLGFQIANGDYLVELDHDDELTTDCLELLNDGFTRYDVGFIYSDCCEYNLFNNTFVDYPDGWGMGYGKKYWTEYNNNQYLVMQVSSINPKTVRHIVSMPNHVRAWSREGYFKSGGHNPHVPICDDYELMIRTFLNTKILHIPKMLYIQNYDAQTTQRVRNKEIQRLSYYFSSFYNQRIKKRFDELNIVDYVYNLNYNWFTMAYIPNPEILQEAKLLYKEITNE